MERYAIGSFVARVAFPDAAVCCRNCRLCRNDDRMRQRYICSETMEIIYDPGVRGSRCPLEMEEDEHGQSDDL